METLVEILEKAKEACGATSDADLSRKIGVTGATVSYWRSGRQTPNSYALMQLQGILKIDARELLAIIEKERAKTEERRNYWDSVVKSFQKTAVITLVGLTLFALNTEDARASLPQTDNQNVYYVKWLRRIIRAIRRYRWHLPFDLQFCQV